MRVFLACSALLSALIALALFQRPTDPEEFRTPAQKGPRPKILCVAYSKIRISGLAEGSLVVHSRLGSELKVKSMGSEIVRAADDGEKLWFWIRPYDRDNFYSCPSTEAEEAGVMPALRPLFTRLVSGLDWNTSENPIDGDESVSDGNYRVITNFSKGLPRSLKYIGDKGEEIYVEFLSHQVINGAVFPRRMRVSMMGGPTVSVDMGNAEVNTDAQPDTKPPSDKRETKI